MKINEYDMVELRAGKFAKDGEFATVLEIFTTPSLGYLVENIDHRGEPVDYPAAYVVESNEIIRVIPDDEADKISDSIHAKRELEFA